MRGWILSRKSVRAVTAALMWAAAMVASAAEHHGRVTLNGLPLPGATVTATQGGKNLAAVTDLQGLYQFPSIDTGEWHLMVEMQGFRAVNATVTIPETTAAPSIEMQMLPLADLLASAKAVLPSAPLPALILPAEKSKAKIIDADVANAPAPAEPEGDADKSADGMLINGSSNNAATSKYSLAQAFGSRRAGSKSLYNGSLGFQLSASPFDARPYSITGLESPKASYTQFTGVATLGGPIRIPHLFYNGPNFFVAYQWTRNRDASTISGLVPTLDQRSGIVGGTPFDISPQAAALLALYPLPNLANSTSYNYQTQVLNGTHTDSLQSRIDKSIGRRDQVFGKLAVSSTRSDTESLFHFRDTIDTFGINSDANWSHRFPHQLFVETTFRFSRMRTTVTPYFANRANISGNAGIAGNLQDATNWGPPDLSFSSGISTLTDGVSAFDRNRTDGVGVSATWTHRHHTVTFGGDFRRQEFNQLQQANPRGSFTFTGAATGSDFQDFLTGVPDASKLAYGNADKYFRQSASDVFVTDDWRMRPELTVNVGVRWDYGAPVTELKGRLVNLDIAPDFSAVAPVIGYSPTGTLTQTRYPSSLVRPDFRKFQPRLGFAWRPLPAKPLVIRGGYGVYVDTSVYLSAAGNMAQQAPLSKSLSVSNSPTCLLTLANGFQDCSGTTSNTFAIDPNFRVGYAQTWRLSAQQDLPGSIVLTGTYLGSKGSDGLQEFLPNTYAPGATVVCAECPRGFLYRTSNGSSIRHAGELQVRRRLRSGLTATLDYLYAHSIDNDAYLGGGATTTYTSALDPYNTPSDTIAQNWQDLGAERSRSSFDQRHLLKFSFQYTSGTGIGGGTLMTGWRGRLLKQWTLAPQLSVGSGLPQTPIYLTTVPGTGFTGTIRPNRTAADLYVASNGYHLNAASFTAPTAGQWGTAGRYSIEGPSSVTLDSSLARTFKLRDPLSFDVRVDGTNVLNHVVFTGWNNITNSSTFGLPVAPKSMRSFELSGRLRF
ncbi:hypothetical protein HDF16_001511 [Granulicella aggregans]|uniref:TonB-dependent transporter Oar-like beta-barrel domain-containing protein n=1 Tax=Granulicella aggregans TaxID=474949 RepID=A0A7W7ZBG1_9BACT|nr:carboxypeptidase regulatory-like domain-containing protein [Granulicella aggregans]MBB5056826.1 hypothetical protein [Granulicella aggregans]